MRRKIKNQFGGRLKAFVSGGGALDKKIGEFLNSIGLSTLQGYGLTETSPVVSCNIPGKIKIETVGPPFKTNEIQIAEDGEILVKGENVMLGYWNMKKETDEILKNADSSKAIPPLYGALLKNEQDVQLLERLAFMSRRESNSK